MSIWTLAHADLLSRYAARYGMPALDGESARTWTRGVAEQFAFSFPGQGWGHKSAGGGRPASTDVIATASPFEGYDLLLNQGMANQELITHPSPIPLPGQVYIPVTPTDHLGGGPPPPPPPTTLEARVAALEAWARGIAYRP